jgi:hypothetical protein
MSSDKSRESVKSSLETYERHWSEQVADYPDALSCTCSGELDSGDSVPCLFCRIVAIFSPSLGPTKRRKRKPASIQGKLDI